MRWSGGNPETRDVFCDVGLVAIETRVGDGRAVARFGIPIFRLIPRFRGMRTRSAVLLVCAAFVLGAALALSLGLGFLRRSTAPRVVGTATVIQQIQSLSDLVTVKYVMQKIVIFTNASTTTLGQLPNVVHLPGFSEDRITLLAHGVVKGGVDLSKLSARDVQASGEKIVVRLPQAVVTDAYLDETQTQVLDRRSGLMRRFEPTLEQQARQYARLEMTRAARQDGIEREAEQRAREQLQRLLKSCGYRDVVFESR